MKVFLENLPGNSMPLPTEVRLVLNRFKSSNIEAFVVGGCVRDHLLGRKTQDFDLTTAALPQKVLELFSDTKTLTTGIKHGTVTVFSGDLPLEITTFRNDGEYKDSRHPETVSFSNSLTEDLARRDFTVNAICYSPETGFVDPFGGAKDIKSRLIRAVGVPQKRFEEDALRILRALRFASVSGFTLETETEKALITSAHLLKNISKERIFVEFKKLLCGNFATDILNKYFFVLAENIFDEDDICKKDLNFNPISKTADDIVLKLATFFAIMGAKEALAEKLLKSLKCDNKTIMGVKAVLGGYYFSLPKTKYDVKCLLNRYGKENTKRIFSVCLVLNKLCENEYGHLIKVSEEILGNNECCSLKDLALKGDELINLGVPPKRVGEILNTLLQKVMCEEAENTKNCLLSLAENIIKSF